MINIDEIRVQEEANAKMVCSNPQAKKIANIRLENSGTHRSLTEFKKRLNNVADYIKMHDGE